LIIASLPVVVAFLGATASGSGPALGSSVAGLLRTCFFEMLFFGLFFGAAWVFSRASRDDLLLPWRPGPWVIPLGVVYSVAIRAVAVVATLVVLVIAFAIMRLTPAQMQQFFLEHRPKVEKIIDPNALSQQTAYYWLSVTLVSFVLGGLREELWRSAFLAGLRSLSPRAFGSTNGGILAAGVAALFFGIGHYPQGWLLVCMVTIVGFLLGGIMVVHRSVWPSVLAHGFFDATTMALLPALARYLQEIQHVPTGG
jgi:membrane protease YdiL (CAAX protease family)